MKAEPLFNRKTPMAAASYWFNQQRSGAMTGDDIREFEVWLDRDPAHKAAFEKMEMLWDAAAGVEYDPAIMASCERDVGRVDRSAQARSAALIAASVALLAFGGWGLMRAGLLAELGLWAPSPVQELRTSIGQRTTVTLKDNSVVTLDTDTLVRIRDFSRERRIELVHGRAYFSVAKDPSRPFIVAAAGKTVRATGTAFDVRVEPQRFEVTLIEGRVRVQTAGKEKDKAQTADMRRGWRLAVGADQHWRMSPVDVDRETSWHDGRLAFVRFPLTEAVAEMNRYSERKIVFRGAAPDAVIGGVFRTGDIDGFVRAIRMDKLARVESESEDEIALTSP